MLYKLYRKLPNGEWKYSDAYNSTLDPNYHADINYLNKEKVEWELRYSNNVVKFKSDNAIKELK